MKRLANLIVLVVLLLGASSSVTGQTVAQHPRVKQALNLVQVWLDAQRAYQQIPGVSAAVVYDQQLLWSAGFGYADLSRKTLATPSTVYSICSISKLFTSIGVMQLRDEGKLRLDDPVRHTPGLKSSAATRLRDREAERLKTKSSDNREIVGEDKTHIADMLYSHL